MYKSYYNFLLKDSKLPDGSSEILIYNFQKETRGSVKITFNLTVHRRSIEAEVHRSQLSHSIILL